MNFGRSLAASLLFAFASLAAPVEAAKFYVDAKLGDLKPEAVAAVAEPQPVQLIFEFQTDGVRNAKATDYAKPIIVKAIAEQKIFANTSDTPVPSNAVLSIVMNNLSEKGAAGKGFKAGFTFGLAGVAVTDRYHVRFELLPAHGGTPIICEVDHALHMTMGKKEDPAIGILVKKPDEGMQMIIRQIVAHGLNGIASDSAFGAAMNVAAAR